MAADEPKCIIEQSERRVHDAMRQAWRQREIAQACDAATQMRPWFYENYVRRPAVGIDRRVEALLANHPMTPAEERRASWHLMRDLCWRLRHGSEYPRLSASARHTIRVAIRAELRRIAIRSERSLAGQRQAAE
jgi:hypothetical protein